MAAQIVTMLCLFCLAFAAVIATAAGLPIVAPILLLAGHRGVEILDQIAALKLEAPLYFARLRPAQMAVPIACLFFTIVLLVRR